MALPLRRQIFYGTFIHSKSRTELEYLHKTHVFVDEHGKIVKIKKFDSEEQDLSKVWEVVGWKEDEVDVIVAEEGQFFFPGFIGESP